MNPFEQHFNDDMEMFPMPFEDDYGKIFNKLKGEEIEDFDEYVGLNQDKGNYKEPNINFGFIKFPSLLDEPVQDSDFNKIEQFRKENDVALRELNNDLLILKNENSGLEKRMKELELKKIGSTDMRFEVKRENEEIATINKLRMKLENLNVAKEKAELQKNGIVCLDNGYETDPEEFEKDLEGVELINDLEVKVSKLERDIDKLKKIQLVPMIKNTKEDYDINKSLKKNKLSGKKRKRKYDDSSDDDDDDDDDSSDDDDDDDDDDDSSDDDDDSSDDDDDDDDEFPEKDKDKIRLQRKGVSKRINKKKLKGAKMVAYEQRRRNPGNFFYRFTEYKSTCKFDDKEGALYKKKVEYYKKNQTEWPGWGLFSMSFPTKNGLTCSQYYKKVYEGKSPFNAKKGRKRRKLNL